MNRFDVNLVYSWIYLDLDKNFDLSSNPANLILVNEMLHYEDFRFHCFLRFMYPIQYHQQMFVYLLNVNYSIETLPTIILLNIIFYFHFNTQSSLSQAFCSSALSSIEFIFHIIFSIFRLTILEIFSTFSNVKIFLCFPIDKKFFDYLIGFCFYVNIFCMRKISKSCHR